MENAAGSSSPEIEGSPSDAAINIWSPEGAPKETGVVPCYCSACVMCILVCFSLSCLSVFLFAPLLGRCLLADSTANHHSDVMMSANLLACQLYLRTRVDCVCALPAYPVLQHGQQFVSDTNSLPMLNVSCLMSHALCCAM